MKWTQEAWDLFEAVLESHGYYIQHCAHCGRPDRGAAWGVTTDHPTCLVRSLDWASGLSLIPFTPEYYTGC